MGQKKGVEGKRGKMTVGRVKCSIILPKLLKSLINMIALISSQDGSVKFSVTVIIVVVVTQCSAGVGRTGVFVTLSIVLERMRYEGVVDMFQTVKMLFTQRPAMVQTEVQNL